MSIKIHAAVGLPGSGKTTWAKSMGLQENRSFRNNNVKVWHFDDLTNSRKNGQKLLKEIVQSINSYKVVNEHVLDGLFLTNEIQKELIKAFKNKDVEIIFHYWKPDIEACLWNDKYRRKTNSIVTIENAIIEKPTNELGTIKIEEHITKRKSSYHMFKDMYNLEDELKSDSWCMGGAYGNCWDDSMSPVGGEAPLSSFKEFDDLMEQVCPSMTFLKYKKIYNHCVSSDTSYESDYYGGGVTYGFYKCDTQKLFEMLVDTNLIDEQNFSYQG